MRIKLAVSTKDADANSRPLAQMSDENAPPRPPVVVFDVVTALPATSSGRWFCYLMKQLGGYSKNEANIKMSTQPYQDVTSHNRGDSNDKTTKPAKGHWQIEMLIGPLDEDESKVITKNWMSTSRGLTSRRARGLQIVLDLRNKQPDRLVFCFDKRLVPIPLEPQLKRIGMGNFAAADIPYWKLIGSVSTHATSKKRQRVVQANS